MQQEAGGRLITSDETSPSVVPSKLKEVRHLGSHMRFYGKMRDLQPVSSKQRASRRRPFNQASFIFLFLGLSSG